MAKAKKKPSKPKDKRSKKEAVEKVPKKLLKETKDPSQRLKSPNQTLALAQAKIKRDNELYRKQMEQDALKRNEVQSFLKSKVQEARSNMENLQASDESSSLFGDTSIFNETDKDLSFDDGANTVSNNYSGNFVDSEPLDVFTYATQVLTASGDHPRFEIFRDGEQVGTKMGKYSWDRLQEEYGGGDFIVKAKSRISGRYVKQEARCLGGMRKDLNRNDSQENSIPSWALPLLESRKEPQASQSLGLQEILILLGSMNKSDPSTAIIAKTQSESTTQFMTTLMTTMQTQQSQNQTMMMEMQKANNEMMKQLQDSTNKMFEKLSEKMEKGKNELSPLQLLEMVQKSSGKALEDYKNMQEQIEELVEKRLDAEKDDSPKEESLMGTLSKTLLPLIQQNAQIQAQQNQVHEQLRLEQRRREEEVLRRSQNVRPEPRPQNPQPYQNGSTPSPVNPKVETKLGEKINFVENQPKDVSEVIEASPASNNKKARLFELSAEPIGEELLGDNPNGKNAGIKVLKVLNANKFSSKDFLEEWTLQGIIEAAKEMGLYKFAEARNQADELSQFLKDMYDYIQSKAEKINRPRENPSSEKRPAL